MGHLSNCFRTYFDKELFFILLIQLMRLIKLLQFEYEVIKESYICTRN
jgi:hypothetical protein